jgi:hypothetical protein
MTLATTSNQFKFNIKKCFLALLCIIGSSTISQAQNQLTLAQKIEDFNYLYQEFKSSYPYFGINKRVHKTDWLANKTQYLQQIKATTNDTTFFKVMNTIYNDLNNGHTDAYPTIIYKYFHDAYTYGASQDSTYNIYVNELEKTNVERSKHWEGINRELFFPENKTSTDDSTPSKEVPQKAPNVNVQFIDDTSIAIVHVASFSYDFVEQDADTLKHFFNKAQHYKNLIIDIQGNEGGSTEYWLDNMIPYLIDKPMSYPIIYGFKNSERLKTFKPHYFKDTITYESIKLPKMPKELKDGSYLFRKEMVTIEPNSATTNAHSGNIYLLVDQAVFSSAEALAYFFKASKFGIVAGEKTSGDGVGTDPLILTLPHSGIVLRFTGEMGLNPDGSANDETKTTPDLNLDYTNSTERRNALIAHIQKHKN